MMDVAKVRKEVVAYLKDHQYTERDSDGQDFQFHDDSTLRFKVGCVRGEVTVTVWKNDRQMKKPIRILNEGASLVEAKYEIDRLVTERAAEGFDKFNIVDGEGNFVASYVEEVD